MTRRIIATFLYLSVSLFALNLQAQQEDHPAPTPADKAAKPAAEGPKEKPAAAKEEPPVVTHHQITVGGRVLKYTATTGYMPLRNPETDEIEANIFFMAYTLDNPTGKRPLMFSFNGGPGSASVWLHLGAIGPKRVKMLPDGEMPAPPFELVDNQQTWLDQTDLVFIDPVGTGFSRATKKELGKKFWSVEGDIASVGEFIRLYLTRYQRWNSPLFLVGESYGTTRAAGLERIPGQPRHRAQWRGAHLLGAELPDAASRRRQRSALHPVPAELHLDARGITRSFLPICSSRICRRCWREVEQYAAGPYTLALGKGESLTPQERDGAD